MCKLGIYADRVLLEQKSDKAFIQAINEVYFGRTAGINRVFNAYGIIGISKKRGESSSTTDIISKINKK